MPVERGTGDTGLAGDIGHRRIRHALTLIAASRRVEDSLHGLVGSDVTACSPAGLSARSRPRGPGHGLGPRCRLLTALGRLEADARCCEQRESLQQDIADIMAASLADPAPVCTALAGTQKAPIQPSLSKHQNAESVPIP